ncbi:DNA primase [Candidatus Azambacteria bacterium RIFOXYC1_FULL_41_20]|nr:MAG: primase protein [Candidatus Azambacteria bacterium GW2011_GWF1_41_10]KKS49569.1 MAG: primase protein [Candidatus Azambacteria bacterium GW2011_GWF2_42_22]KKT03680.1 MAG: primase protein [Candidatus Azambacteria bacterium GW2011_GWD1_43_18]KKT12834.1 MAG: primase protein [Candidatus Azambacteria bacterium GW2011_GWC2_43_27]OGD41466.1 MAG: DNA primase [Candidatus Azambacteria bacterium RIFOXYB1_FULL_40_33]OGD42835.1 MAG: DNA primase [Candidatus Azambacteria bacterium RIFOXYA1_FULL_42_37]
MSDQVQEIKEKLNIVDVISGYLRLHKAGVNYRALCPFHNEKTPSFMVSPSRQNWHCFGCAEGGDIFSFIQKIEAVEFPEVLKMLAEKAGVVLKYGDPKLRSEKDRIYEICEKAAQFFAASLGNSTIVLKYLGDRGLKNETISEWRLGYAPDSWNSLLLFLTGRGYREQEIEKAGLILSGQRYHDRFRNRLMFPIFDANGRVVAFSGRIMSDIISSKTERAESGKYINSPETILFSKSKILYGLDKAKMEIRKNDKVVLVEGQMDTLLPWQDGVKNVVATSGTALTEDHLSILKRLTTNLVLAFDVDEAGSRATKRGVNLANEMGFGVSIVKPFSGKDPADFVKEQPGKFGALVADSRPIMEHYFHQVFEKFDPSKIESKKIAAITLLSEIKRLPSAMDRSHWLRELSLQLGIDESDLKEEMGQIEIEKDTPKILSIATAEVQNKNRKEILSERLLALLLKKPELMAEATKAAGFLPVGDFEILRALAANGGDFSGARSALAVDLRPRLDFLYLAGDYEIEKAGSDFLIAEEIASLAKAIEKEHYKEKMRQIGMEIKKREARLNDAAGQAGEDLDLSELTNEFQNISNKLYKQNESKK